MRDEDRMAEWVPRHEIDSAAMQIVDAGSVAPIVYSVPMPAVRPEGPNFARSFGGELLGRALIFDPHAGQPRTWYYAGMSEAALTKRFRAEGIASGFDRHDRVPGWRAAFWWAVIARDTEAMEELIAYPLERLRESGAGAFDEFQYEWALLLREAWRYGPETVGEQAWGLDTTSAVGAQEVVDQLLRPSIEVFARLGARDQEGFGWELGNALRRHRAFFDRATWCNDPEGVFSLPLLGLACWAHDLGMRIDVESDYLPRGFVYRADWHRSPELAAVLAAVAEAQRKSPR
ncbi:immunity 49 family protein [Nocardia sp. NPDC006630]|uniref:immunity 49 family protein n=1 Tax=Nocardia sp. NPDC006630 TaxID=3157181 RepID=UPI0033AD7DF2